MMPPAVVVSLPSAHERRQRISGTLNFRQLDFEFFDAVDGDDGHALTNSFVCRPDFFSPAYTRREKPVSGRELACTLSHMRAIRHVWSKRLAGPLLVLEDDAIFCTMDQEVIEAVLWQIPDDASYLQLALSPVGTVEALAESYARGGNLLVGKTGNCAVESERGLIRCHCTAAYLITEKGMRELAERWFESDRCIFPCTEEQLKNNGALVSDRLVYQAATSSGARGYVCAAPLMTTAALESSLHPDHVHMHVKSRDMAHKWSEALTPRILSSSRTLSSRFPPSGALGYDAD